MNMNGFIKYLPYIAFILMAAGAWFTVRMQAVQALPRAEALETFVTIAQQNRFEERTYKEFDRINNKLDRLLEGR